MSIIGHAVGNHVANVHAASKQQQAAQTVQSDEDARRHLRILKEEQDSREAVRESDETHENRVHRRGEKQSENRPDEKLEPQIEEKEDDGSLTTGDEPADRQNNTQEGPGAHIDVLA